jgi:hypothetical protein
MSEIEDLDMLAKCWPILFGKSLDPGTVLGVAPTLGGRTDAVDEMSSDLCRAIRALDRLNELAKAPQTLWVAKVLLFARVFCGVKARRNAEVYLRIATLERDLPKRLSPQKRAALLARGIALYDLAVTLYLADKTATPILKV